MTMACNSIFSWLTARRRRIRRPKDPFLKRRDRKHWNRLYHEKPDRTFEDVTEKAGLRGAGYWRATAGCAVGDYDNNGYEDLYITAYGLISCNGIDVAGKAGHGVAGLRVLPRSTSTAFRALWATKTRACAYPFATRDSDSAWSKPTQTWCAALWFRGCRASRESGAIGMSSLESLGPAGTKNGKAHRPKRRKVRPIKPCSFTHSSKGAQPLAEGELSLPQLVWQCHEVQAFNQPFASFASRFRPDRLAG